MDTIAERIKYIRKSLSMNQSTFANEIQLSQASLSDIEKGKYKPSVDTLINISKRFGISADWIIKGDEYLSEQFLNSDIVNNAFNTINKQVSKGKLDLMNTLNINEQIANAMYNSYFLKIIIPSMSMEEKSLLEIYRNAAPDLKKEYLSILHSLHFNTDIKNMNKKNEASS